MGSQTLAGVLCALPSRLLPPPRLPFALAESDDSAHRPVASSLSSPCWAALLEGRMSGKPPIVCDNGTGVRKRLPTLHAPTRKP